MRHAPTRRPARTTAAVFGQRRVDVAVFDHHRIVEHRHVGHAAVGMARVEVTAEQRVLLARRFVGRCVADDVGIGAQHPLLAGAGTEVGDQDPDRDAGAAVLAGRPVGDRLRATEAGLGQRVVQAHGASADEMREHLPLLRPRQIGAGRRGGEIELGGVPHLASHAVALLKASHDAARLERIAPKRNTPVKLFRTPNFTCAARRLRRRACRAGSVSRGRPAKRGRSAERTSLRRKTGRGRRR